ncbi:hypothetical protein U1Q18_013741, partial [Sarracenia purpurea var. burkii]
NTVETRRSSSRCRAFPACRLSSHLRRTVQHHRLTPLRDATALLATVVRRQTPPTSTSMRRHCVLSSSALATAVPCDQIHRRRPDPSPSIARDPPSITVHSSSPSTGSQGLSWILRRLLRPAPAQHRRLSLSRNRCALSLVAACSLAPCARHRSSPIVTCDHRLEAAAGPA